MHKLKFLTREEFRAADDARMALAETRGNDPEWIVANRATYGYAKLDEITGPNVMWECPWYHDPEDPTDAGVRERALAWYSDPSKGNSFLSRFYWKDWSHIRPPLTVLCPNGAEWTVDQVSSNGEGWTVTFEGDWKDGLISCSPSIQVPGYHGFLGSNGTPPGYFSDPV